MQIKRVWHPVSEWEEISFNMWGSVSDKQSYLEKAIKFTGDHSLYGSYMIRVINEWPISCENALTDSNLNQKAWVGHAASALALNCPESITREAWGYLKDEQRLLANREAENAIKTWANNYAKSRRLSGYVEQAMLSGINSRGSAQSINENKQSTKL